ncbi:uncharacterized protein LOC104911045 [Meleagris gallopavo]|uniref:uncharacterized protein LOC104911045 n=1 Tax=Meleagris gallopavo TaxID=9103 RepID=UPI00093F24F8|nr:uncharacterized protein LOC104911045 [Meleagris gallopavo]
MLSPKHRKAFITPRCPVTNRALTAPAKLKSPSSWLRVALPRDRAAGPGRRRAALLPLLPLTVRSRLGGKLENTLASPLTRALFTCLKRHREAGAYKAARAAACQGALGLALRKAKQTAVAAARKSSKNPLPAGAGPGNSAVGAPAGPHAHGHAGEGKKGGIEGLEMENTKRRKKPGVFPARLPIGGEERPIPQPGRSKKRAKAEVEMTRAVGVGLREPGGGEAEGARSPQIAPRGAQREART